MGSKIRELKDSKVKMGMAIDAATGEEFPAKLVQAVRVGADVPGAVGTGKTIPATKRAMYREAFQPFVVPAKKFLEKKGSVTWADLGKHLKSLPISPAWASEALMKQTGTKDMKPTRPFLESFPDVFRIDESHGFRVELAAQATAGTSSTETEPTHEKIASAASAKKQKAVSTPLRMTPSRDKTASPKILTIKRTPVRAASGVRSAPPKISGVRRGPRRAVIK